jgi:hypothetical protein
VHNRGRTNEQFLSTIGDDGIDLDIPMIVSPGEPELYQMSLVQIAAKIDFAFIQECGVKIFTSFRPFPTFTEGVKFGT